MNEAYFITSCVVSFSIIAAVILGPLASLRRDKFHSDVRKIRDNLFDFVYEHGFDFNTKAYRDTRQMLNGMLRMSDRLTPVRVIAGVFFFHWYGNKGKNDFTSYEGCPATLKEKLEEATALAVCRMIVYLFVEGPFGLAVKCLFVAARQYKKIDLVARQLSVDLYFLGAPPGQLTVSQRILLRH